ncbi:MAG TPA: type II 3-dehydroquinate dehydratase [Candidatus Sulfotelmatobacter sp.]|nr:type II 3-dehydroquinate dehydratase [Candidatus Sulfotelmatobacter sp.]
MKILVVNGPNLNLLGEREPAVYGTATLADLERAIRKRCKKYGWKVKFFQSNHEGAIIDELHARRAWADAVLINPAAFTHYSWALRDAILAIQVPTVEVHLSDLDARAEREEFRRLSVVRDVCVARFTGRGIDSYLDALDFLVAPTETP